MLPVHAADRLLSRIESAGAPVCVGLDPVAERMPPELRPAPGDAAAAAAVEAFSRGVLDAVAGVVPAVKVQAACFERQGPEGVAALASLLGEEAPYGTDPPRSPRRFGPARPWPPFSTSRLTSYFCDTL